MQENDAPDDLIQHIEEKDPEGMATGDDVDSPIGWDECEHCGKEFDEEQLCGSCEDCHRERMHWLEQHEEKAQYPECRACGESYYNEFEDEKSYREFPLCVSCLAEQVEAAA